MFKTAFLFLFTWSTTLAHSQSNKNQEYLRVGDRIPDYIFEDVKYSPSKKVSFADFRGKPLILDFFSLGCVSCFAGFPEMNRLSEKYKNKTEYLLVGLDSKQHGAELRRAYSKYKKRFSLGFPVVFDSVIFELYGLRGVPKFVLIDSAGIVRAITSSLNERQVRNFVENKPFEFDDRSNAAKRRTIPVNLQEPLFINGNGGPDTIFIQRSVISLWNGSFGSGIHGTVGDYHKHGLPLQVLDVTLSDLYRMAYFGIPFVWDRTDSIYGKCRYSLQLEIRDSSKFSDTVKYCYSQILPDDRISIRSMLNAAQMDLQNAFGYEASVEIRKSSYLRLVALKDAKDMLKTKGGKQTEKWSVTGVNFINSTIAKLLNTIAHYKNTVAVDLPIVDETGINDKIDITFEAAMTDFEDVKRMLRKNGLDLVVGEREMETIVIKDTHD